MSKFQRLLMNIAALRLKLADGPNPSIEREISQLWAAYSGPPRRNPAKGARTSIATGNRHGGAHQHARARARRLRQAAAA